MSLEHLPKRMIHHPRKVRPGHRSRSADKIGNAQTTSPSELGLMMHTREGSSRASRGTVSIIESGTPFPERPKST